MDFNGNVHVEQRDRLEESRLNTPVDGAEKIQLVENVKGNDREIDQRSEYDSLKNLSTQNFVENEQHRTANPQGENYIKMTENPNHFDENHVWERKNMDQRYDNYGNENNASRSDQKGTEAPYRNCKSGINISVISHGQLKDNSVVEKPMYSVSFKCCYDNQNPKWENKRRKLIPTIGSKSKKIKVQDSRNENALPVQQVSDDCASNQGNYRCTFENCCGNCESYIVEIPNSDCNTYKNWQNNHFETGNTCLDDCCCPREMKVYSSNLSVLPRTSCGACVDGRKCCSTPTEPKCDFIADDYHTVNKQCLQRVHFAKNDGRPKRNHSSCSFCARKCTPSKASLFVQIDESATDMCGLTSAQAFQHAYSMESFKNYDYGAVENDEFDSSRRKSTKRSDPTCNPRCMGRPGAVGRSFSDKFPHMNSQVDHCAAGQNEFSRETLRNARSNVEFQEALDGRTQKESNMSMNKKTADYNQQCNTDERSLWGDIRKGKIWTQLQDTYKNFVKVASTGIDQIVRQSSKLKRSKKSAKDCITCGTSTKECEKNISRSDQCNQSETCDDCLHEAACWNEIMTHEPTDCDTHCCRSFYCENIASLPECQKVMCQNDHEGNALEEITSRENWRFDARDNVQWNPYTTCKESYKCLKRSKPRTYRKRGGGDHSNQKRKSSNANRRPNQNTGEKSTSSGNAKIQVAKRQAQPLMNSDQQTERNIMHIDVSVQANTVHAMADDPDAPYVTESLAYRRRVKAMRQYEAYSNQPTDYSYNDSDSPAMIRDTPVIQEIDSTLHPLPPVVKRLQAQPKRPITQGTQPTRCMVPSMPASSKGIRQEPTCRQVAPTSRRDSCTPKDRPMARQDKSSTSSSTNGKGVQCMIVRELRLICGAAGQRQAASRVDHLCLCSPKTTAEQKDAPPAEPGVSKAASAEEPVEKSDDADVVETAVEDMPVAADETEQDAQAEQAEPVTESATEEAPVAEETPETDQVPVVEESTDQAADQEAGQATDQEVEQVVEQEAVPVAELVDVNVAEPEEKDAGHQASEKEALTEEEPVVESVVEEAVIDEITEDVDPSEGKEGTVVEDVTNTTVMGAGTIDPADGEPAVSDQYVAISSVEPTTGDEAPGDTSVEVIPRSPLTPPVPDSRVDADQLDSPSPIEISKDFNGKHTHVSVQMQTSNTILTKILSEFQIGNKKQQVLMSIKLQTNLDDDENEDTRNMPDHLHPDQRRRPRRPSNTRSAQYRSRRNRAATGGSGYQEDRSNSYGLDDSPSPPRSRYNSCSGPCGKKKLR